MQILKSTVGRKILMALTGLGMVGFVCTHLLGNSSIFAGPGGINAYAEHLHSLGPLVWVFRLVMLALLTIHVVYGVQLTLENNAANPQGYAVNKMVKATFASKTMIWTGVIIVVFIGYHISHFTVRAWSDVSAFAGQVPGNVFGMVVGSFQHGIIAFVYIVAMVALLLHLSHGVQSFFQTLGLSNDRTQCGISKGGKALAIILGVGYIAIPLSILIGILK
jgi:succinate dehydrogenase / fumarate reductase, cytochrome b subunit